MTSQPIPNANQIDSLGELLSHLEAHWMSDNARALALIYRWQEMLAAESERPNKEDLS